jgi:diguanylate cyclase (GGDEF)-like protein
MDRVLGGTSLVFAAAAILIGWGPEPGITTWSAQLVFELIFAGLSWRLSCRLAQPPAARALWRAAAVAGVLFGVASVLRAVDVVVDPGDGTMHETVPYALITLATAVLLVFSVWLPWELSGRERVRLWLDMATVLVAAAVVTWIVMMIGQSGADTSAQLAWTIVGAVTLILSAFALVRLLFTRTPPYSVATGVTLSLAIALFGVEHALNAQFQATSDVRGTLVARMVPALLLAVAPRFEERRAPAVTAGAAPPNRRVITRLPFVAVAVTQVVLVVELAITGLTDRTWGAVGGAVVVTTLVMVRQTLVLVDNESLVRRLDHTVDMLARQERQLRYAVNHDHLTGLANRASFDAHADRLAADAGRGRAVLMLDLNEFKTVNDTLGHHAGDELLKVTANRLRRSVRPVDTVVRLGGDEFSVLLVDALRDDAVAAAHRVIGAVREPVTIGGHTLRPSASVGIAASASRPYEALLRDADKAMYEAKRRHSGFYVHPR